MSLCTQCQERIGPLTLTFPGFATTVDTEIYVLYFTITWDSQFIEINKESLMLRIYVYFAHAIVRKSSVFFTTPIFVGPGVKGLFGEIIPEAYRLGSKSLNYPFEPYINRTRAKS